MLHAWRKEADIELKCIVSRCRRVVLGDTWREIACENLLIRTGWQEFANWSVAACLPGGIRSRGSRRRFLREWSKGIVSYYCCAASGVTYCASGPTLLQLQMRNLNAESARLSVKLVSCLRPFLFLSFRRDQSELYHKCRQIGLREVVCLSAMNLSEV